MPEGARRIEAQGRYLILGLIDVHSNLLSDDRIAAEYADEEFAVIVANGVTTIRDRIGNPELLAYREQIADGELLVRRSTSPVCSSRELPTGAPRTAG